MTDRRIIIEELGKPALVSGGGAFAGGANSSRFDLQDALLAGGIALGEVAAWVIWWPAALILGCLFCFGFAYMIEIAKSKEKRGNPKP